MISKLLAAAICCHALGAAELQEVPFETAQGETKQLKDYAGKVVLLVNVASKCGLTPQYEGLEALYQKHREEGLVILAFPANDFGNQEPGTIAEIQAFCKERYNVSFPLMQKLHVKGPEQHPLYAALTGEKAAFPGEISWNFGKFLIGRDGKPLQRFEPKTAPEDPGFVKAIEAALATPTK